ncbi:uncharacterized protein [Procambarus clarkii]
MCPQCMTAVHVRIHVCACGHSFLKEKLEVDKKKEAHQLVMGKKAAKNNTLTRSFATLQKHSNRLRGGGYRVAVLYYKEGNQRSKRGILPGSSLTEKQGSALAKIFCSMSRSVPGRKKSSLENVSAMDFEWKPATTRKSPKTRRVGRSVRGDVCDDSDSCLDDSLIEVKKEAIKVECWGDNDDGYYDMCVGDDRDDSKDSLHINENSAGTTQ